MDRLCAMNKRVKYILFGTVFCTAISFMSCQSTADSQTPDDTVVQDEIEPETAVSEAPAAEETTPEIQPEEPAPEEPKEVIVNEETGYEVSKEKYEQTLDEIKELIDTLNNIISNKKYDKWKLFLSEEYIKTYNDPVKLKQISDQSQILSDNGIVLTNLKDYFDWVVVPSRSAARVDDIVFLDDKRLVVYMKISNKNTILYQLENIDEKWQISVW